MGPNLQKISPRSSALGTWQTKEGSSGTGGEGADKERKGVRHMLWSWNQRIVSGGKRLSSDWNRHRC